jgi:hypothetical protein
LKKLSLSFSEHVTSTGWVACFNVLTDSRSAFEEVKFGGNEIDDEGATALVDLVSMHMSTILSMKLLGNSSVTASEWNAFGTVLLSGLTSKLQEIRIHFFDDTIEYQYIDDNVIAAFTATHTIIRL